MYPHALAMYPCACVMYPMCVAIYPHSCVHVSTLCVCIHMHMAMDKSAEFGLKMVGQGWATVQT